MKIYTKTGDSGETSLFDNTRVSKADARVDAYGEVDEVNAWLGAARAAGVDPDMSALIEGLQKDLFALGARLADPSARIAERVTKAAITDADVQRLEQDLMSRGNAAFRCADSFCRRIGGGAAAPGSHRLPSRRAWVIGLGAGAGRTASSSTSSAVRLLFVMAAPPIIAQELRKRSVKTTIWGVLAVWLGFGLGDLGPFGIWLWIVSEGTRRASAPPRAL